MGSATVGGWIAHGAFLVLLLRIWVELRPRTAIIFAVLWSIGYFGLPFILYGEAFFMPYVAVLDIVMLAMLTMQDDTPLHVR